MRVGNPFQKRITLALAGLLFLTSCAQTNQPVAIHMQANQYQPEHDEVVSREAIVDYYPDRTSPHEVVSHRNSGGMSDLTCMDTDCGQMKISITGSKTIPDGSYEFIKTDDSHIVMVRDSEGARILGYLAQNKGGGGYQFYPDLAGAQAFEHKGDAMRTAGKVALGILIGAAIVALAFGAGAGAAAAHSDQVVTTHCSSFGNSTTCTSN